MGEGLPILHHGDKVFKAVGAVPPEDVGEDSIASRKGLLWNTVR